MISVRVLKSSEHDRVRSLINAIFPRTFITIAKDDIIVIAEVGSTPVGFAHIIGDADRVILQGIGVVDNMRNQGVGALILEHSLGLLYRWGKPMFLKVKMMNPAVDLYTRYGFCVKRFGAVSVLVKRIEN